MRARTWQGAMSDTPDKRAMRHSDPGGVAEAMNRVLAAERDALAEVEVCRLEAEKTLEAARREARTILDRAERVARDIHGRTERLAATRARRLVEAAREREDGKDPGDAIATAVERLAAAMTGAGDA